MAQCVEIVRGALLEAHPNAEEWSVGVDEPITAAGLPVPANTLAKFFEFQHREHAPSAVIRARNIGQGRAALQADSWIARFRRVATRRGPEVPQQKGAFATKFNAEGFCGIVKF